LLASAVVYLPLAVAFGSMTWSAFGPFTFQTSRILHYFLYFTAGVALGAYGIERTFLAEGGPLARRWGVWVGGAWGAI
jgi:hypothetical protein